MKTSPQEGKKKQINCFVGRETHQVSSENCPLTRLHIYTPSISNPSSTLYKKIGKEIRRKNVMTGDNLGKVEWVGNEFLANRLAIVSAFAFTYYARFVGLFVNIQRILGSVHARLRPVTLRKSDAQRIPIDFFLFLHFIYLFFGLMDRCSAKVNVSELILVLGW